MFGFQNSEDFYSVMGFYLTLFGTLMGIASLIFAIYISKTAKKIKQKLMQQHIQEKYRKTKKTLLTDLNISYKFIKEDGLIDVWKIRETIISINLYNNILSKDTKKKVRKLNKNVHKYNQNEKWWKIFRKCQDDYQKDIGIQVYDLLNKLESDFDEHEIFLEVITN